MPKTTSLVPETAAATVQLRWLSTRFKRMSAPQRGAVVLLINAFEEHREQAASARLAGANGGAR